MKNLGLFNRNQPRRAAAVLVPPRRTLAANSMRCIPGLRFRQGEVRLHPWMTGELSRGNLHDRSEVLPLLQGLAAATMAGDADVLPVIKRDRLRGRGIDCVDAPLGEAEAEGFSPGVQHQRLPRG